MRAVVTVDAFDEDRPKFTSSLLITQIQSLHFTTHKLGEPGSHSPSLRSILFNITQDSRMFAFLLARKLALLLSIAISYS